MRAVALVLLAACAGTSAPPTDDTDPDTDAPDTDLPADTGETDAVDTDPAETDLADTDPVDSDTGGCMPVGLEERMVLCAGVETLAYYTADPLDETCPSGWELDGATGPDLAALIDGAGCDRTCVWRQHQAVMVLYCDTRGEYVVWTGGHDPQVDPTTSCDERVEAHTVAGSAWADSWEAYQAVHPCP